MGNNTPPDTWTEPSGATSWTGSETTSDITGQTIYTLHCSPIKNAVGTLQYPSPASGCTHAGVGSTLWTDQTCTVNIVPSYIEQ